MSISEPQLKNPSTKFIDFKGDEGKFQYYDKDKKENITLALPIYFVVLDQLSTISGFCEKTKSGIYSNEVHRISDEILNVRTFKGGENFSGYYRNISDKIKVLGGKFCKSVYAMLIGKSGSTELVNFKFKGASFSSWINYKYDTNDYIVGIVSLQQATKGKTVYNLPVFKPFKMPSDIKEIAITMDRQLQEYLRAYKSFQIEKMEVKPPQLEEATSQSLTNKEPQAQDKKAEVAQALSMMDKANRPEPLNEVSEAPDDDFPESQLPDDLPF